MKIIKFPKWAEEELSNPETGVKLAKGLMALGDLPQEQRKAFYALGQKVSSAGSVVADHRIGSQANAGFAGGLKPQPK